MTILPNLKNHKRKKQTAKNQWKVMNGNVIDYVIHYNYLSIYKTKF